MQPQHQLTNSLNIAAPKHDRLLRLHDIIGRPAKDKRPAIEGIIKGSRAWLLAMTRDGKFPQPIRLGQRFTAWRESDVMVWIGSHQATPVEA